MDPWQDQNQHKMNQLRQPLVQPNNHALQGSDQTMLSNNAQRRISSQKAGGINRREEIELKQFQKPVLDIEKLGKQKQMQQYSVNRGGDIDEETHFPDFQVQKAYDKISQNDELMGESQNQLVSGTPYMLSGRPNESICDKLYQFNMALIAMLLSALTLTCISLTSIPALSSEVDNAERRVEYLPFYSSNGIFAIITFGIIVTFMIIKNIVKYVRFGVSGQNDYYTPQDTLKVGSLLLTVLAGELLFCGLMTLFFVFQKSREFEVCSAINTSLLSMISLILLLASYFGFGGQIQLKQSLGGFIVCVGIICMYLSLSGITTADTGNVNYAEKVEATQIVCYNSLVAFFFSSVVIILKVNNQMNGINWHSGVAWTTFTTGITSSVVIGALAVLGLLSNETSNVEEMATLDGVNFNTKQQMVTLGISGASFALFLIILGAVLQFKPLTRSFALFSLCPIAQLTADQFLFSETQIPRTQLASMLLLCVGSIMISLFADTSSYSMKPFSWFSENSPQTLDRSTRDTMLAIEGSEIRDNGMNSVIRFPVQRKN